MERVKRYQEGHIHLTYLGNTYKLSPLGMLSYDTGELVMENDDVPYINGVVHINTTSETGLKPVLTKEDTYIHVLGVVMEK